MSEGSLWAFPTQIANVHRLGGLRGMPGVQAALTAHTVWVRGSGLNEELFGRLASFSDGPVFVVDAKNRLTPFGKTVPIDRLPDATWELLGKLLEPVLPLARIVNRSFPKCVLTLVRTAVEHEASVLIASWDTFESWAIHAPEVRLQACQFAACGGGDAARVCVRGRPIPPLPGLRFWTVGNIAVPLGLTWSPSVDVDTLQEVLARTIDAEHGQPGTSVTPGFVTDTNDRSAPEGLWIWHNDDRLDVIERRSFVPALRMHVRATSESLKSDVRSGGST